MKPSDKCFICGEAPADMAGIQYTCKKRCTTFHQFACDEYFKDQDTFFELKIRYKEFFIHYRGDDYEYKCNNAPYEDPLWHLMVPLLVINKSAIPKEINNTYDLTRHLISFIPRLEKLISFI